MRLLQRVIEDLERSDEPGHPSHQRAIRTLLAHGPLVVPKAVLADRSNPPRLLASAWRAQLITFLRSIVQTSDRAQQDAHVAYGRIAIGSGMTFAAVLSSRGRVQIGIESAADMRDVVIWQLLLLVREVGVQNVRQCAATSRLVLGPLGQIPVIRDGAIIGHVPDTTRPAPVEVRCPKLFIRRYRQRFCSRACQERAKKKRQREKDRLEQEAELRQVQLNSRKDRKAWVQ